MKMKLILLIEQVFFVCSVLTKKKKERRMDGGQLVNLEVQRITTEEMRAAKKSYEDEERKTCWYR